MKPLCNVVEQLFSLLCGEREVACLFFALKNLHKYIIRISIGNASERVSDEMNVSKNAFFFAHSSEISMLCLSGRLNGSKQRKLIRIINNVKIFFHASRYFL